MTKDKQYNQMYLEYCDGMSLDDVGKMFCMTRQSVYCGFKRRDFKLRSQKKLDCLYFNGKKYTLRNHGYYSCTNGNRNLMHRDVWEFYNGDIPVGYDVHHKNQDKSDNRIKNLELLKKDEHARMYATGHNQYSQK